MNQAGSGGFTMAHWLRFVMTRTLLVGDWVCLFFSCSKPRAREANIRGAVYATHRGSVGFSVSSREKYVVTTQFLRPELMMASCKSPGYTTYDAVGAETLTRRPRKTASARSANAEKFWQHVVAVEAIWQMCANYSLGTFRRQSLSSRQESKQLALNNRESLLS